MTTPHHLELVFDVIEEADGGYVAECLGKNIVALGDTWSGLRADVKNAVEAYFFDGTKPQSTRLRLVRNEVSQMQ
jgi:hypothetical protein